jgi:hypothetical protein
VKSKRKRDWGLKTKKKIILKKNKNIEDEMGKVRKLKKKEKIRH